MHRFSPPSLLLSAALLLATCGALVACSAEPQSRGLPMASLIGPDAPPLTRVAHHSHGDEPASVDPRGAAATASTAPPLPPAVDLVISEVMTDPLLVDDVVGEYVEIIHLGAETASLAGATLVLPDGRAVSLLRPRLIEKPSRRHAAPAPLPPDLSGPDAVVQPGEVLVVRSSRSRRLRLPNRAGRLELRRAGVLLDVAQWAGRWPWPRHKAGKALCRVAPERDGATGRAWRRCSAPLRGVERGSPGVVAARCAWLKARNVRVDSCAVADSGGPRRRLAARRRRL